MSKKPTVTVYEEKGGWYWVQVDESGDSWYNDARGPFLDQHEAWANANEAFRVYVPDLRD